MLLEGSVLATPHQDVVTFVSPIVTCVTNFFPHLCLPIEGCTYMVTGQRHWKLARTVELSLRAPAFGARNLLFL